MATPLTTAEQLALAVLKGDADAALALADAVLETYHGVGRRAPSVRQLTVDRDRLRIAVFLKDDADVGDGENAQRFRDNVNRWLAGDRNQDPALLDGIDRIELFELPAPAATPQPSLDALARAGPLSAEESLAWLEQDRRMSQLELERRRIDRNYRTYLDGQREDSGG